MSPPSQGRIFSFLETPESSSFPAELRSLSPGWWQEVAVGRWEHPKRMEKNFFLFYSQHHKWKRGENKTAEREYKKKRGDSWLGRAESQPCWQGTLQRWQMASGGEGAAPCASLCGRDELRGCVTCLGHSPGTPLCPPSTPDSKLQFPAGINSQQSGLMCQVHLMEFGCCGCPQRS